MILGFQIKGTWGEGGGEKIEGLIITHKEIMGCLKAICCITKFINESWS